ncbi:MAG: FtsX-like permease family protein [Dysgonamonadaceae bacterium]|nr:FtsX-like permease family protein [Dysgonamonadaceae bacterium]
MLQLLKLSWRNIWRNRRRALITIASVFFAVFFCTVFYCFECGVWDKMMENMLRTQTGHIQIHGKGYQDDKSIDNFMIMSAEEIASLDLIDNIENVSPRIETFAMASYNLVSKGVAITGISPAKEKEKSNLPIRLVDGKYLDENDDGALIGEGLRAYLNVAVGDTIALLGQGWHGTTAAGLFPVRGILRLPITEMDNGLIYITITAAQRFIDMPDGYSGILISLKDARKMQKTLEAVSEKTLTNSNESDNYEVLTWEQTMEDLLRTSESDKAFAKLLLIILYLIVGFGILGTVIMMTTERRREFAILISIGMQKSKLKLLFSLEMLMMTLCGIVASLAVTIPIVWWYNIHPITLTGELAKSYADFGMEPVMPMSTEPLIFAYQIIAIFVITCVTFIYPFRAISKTECGMLKIE